MNCDDVADLHSASVVKLFSNRQHPNNNRPSCMQNENKILRSPAPCCIVSLFVIAICLVISTNTIDCLE